ncbi:toxin Doc [Streptomyces sp. NPDC047853]|uniref:toxin Doc n=1 Tax=unclassified Streptomyces TaxID=2593676 RepID=UPI003451A1C8
MERQEELLHDLTVNDYSVFVGLAARHKVDPPRHGQHRPDAFWRAAVKLEECMMLRPLPTRNELDGYTVALAYLSMHDERVNAKFELWRELIADTRALRLDSFSIAERLRSLRLP